MEPTMIIGLLALVLFAVLVGALLPALVQLRAALKESRELMARLGPQVESSLADVQDLTRRVGRSVDDLERGARQVRELLSAASELAATVGQLRASLRRATAIGVAVGPALAAALRAFMERDGNPPPEEASAEDASPAEGAEEMEHA